jgi:cystathionine beta-synthase/cysteine synthase A
MKKLIELAKEEGLLVGGSSGANVWVALKIASELTEPTTIVTVLPDSGIKYLSKIYNDDWMQENNLFHDN